MSLELRYGKCQCGGNLEPYNDNGERLLRCPSCGNVYQRKEIKIEPLKDHLVALARAKSDDNSGYARELSEAANQILYIDADCLLAKFYYAYSQKILSGISRYKDFIINAEYVYEEDRFTKAILDQIVQDGEISLTPYIESHIKRVVSDPNTRSRLLAEFKYACANKQRYLQEESDVFLCSATYDQYDTDKIYQEILEKGLSPWSVQRNIPPASPDKQSLIDKNIRHCKVFVFVSSQAACEWEAEEVLREIRVAVAAEKPIIEYKTQNSALPAFFKTAMPQFDVVCSFDRIENGLGELMYMLRSVVDRVTRAGYEKGKGTGTKAPATNAPKDEGTRVVIGPNSTLEKLDMALRFIANEKYQDANQLYLVASRSEDQEAYLLLGIVYNMWGGLAERSTRRAGMGQEMQVLYRQLVGLSPMPSERETRIYRAITNATSLALLMVTFYMLKDSDRYFALKNRVDLTEVSSNSVLGKLFSVLLNEEDYDSLAGLLRYNKAYDADVALKAIVAASLPADVTKELLDQLSGARLSSNAESELNVAYAEATDDKLKAILVRLLAQNDLPIDLTSLSTFRQLPADLVPLILQNCKGRSLSQIEIENLVLSIAKTKDANAVIDALHYLREVCGIMELGPFCVSTILQQEFTTYTNGLSVIKELLCFNMPVSLVQRMISECLGGKDKGQDRFAYIKLIVEHCVGASPKITVPISTYQEYLIESSLDGALKVDIIAELIRITMSFDAFAGIAKKYLTFGKDALPIKQSVIALFGAKGGKLGADACKLYVDLPVAEYEKGHIHIITELLQDVPSALPKAVQHYFMEQATDDDGQVAKTIADAVSAVDESLLHQILEAQTPYKRNHLLLLIINKIAHPKKYEGDFTLANGAKITCNLIQAAMLFSPEADEDIENVARYLRGQKCDLDDKVVLNKKKVKWTSDEVASLMSRSMSDLCKKYM